MAEPAQPTPAAYGVSIGSYDGVETWTIRAGGEGSLRLQAFASLHERFHHELQHTTAWGLITRFAAEYVRAGISVPTCRRLFWAGLRHSQHVHETYATTLAVALDSDYEALLEDNEVYLDHYRRGRALLAPTPASWPRDRFLVDAVLRACMMSPALARVAVDLPRARIVDFDAPGVRPDDRLAVLERLDLTELRRHVPRPPAGIEELEQLHDAVSGDLARLGLPVMTIAEQRDAVDALFANVRKLLPTLRVELDADRTDITSDDLEELQRERIELNDAPLPLELVTLADVPRRPADFLRDHHALGHHVLAVWARADLLARQFARPNALESRDGHVLALQAAGTAKDGEPVARLAIVEGLNDPSLLAAVISNVRVLTLTTLASLVDAPDDAAHRGKETLFALIDQPVLEWLRHTVASATVRWGRSRMRGDRELTVFSFAVSALPGTIFLHMTGPVGRWYATRWLVAQPDERVQEDAAVVNDHSAEIDAVSQHLISAWWVFDQLGGRRG